MQEQGPAHSPRQLLSSAGVALVVYLLFYLITTYALPVLIGLRAPTETTDGGSLDLTRLIREVKTQVNDATTLMIKNDERPMFQFKELDIEVNFVITREAGAQAPALVPIGVDSKVSSEKVQRIKLTLGPAPEWTRQGERGQITRPPDVQVN